MRFSSWNCSGDGSYRAAIHAPDGGGDEGGEIGGEEDDDVGHFLWLAKAAERQLAQVAVNFAEDAGLIVRPLPTDRIAICPPLIITEAEIVDLFDRLTRALDATADWAKREKLF